MGSNSGVRPPPASRFPDDMPLRLERFGRYTAHRMGGAVDYQQLVDLVLAPFAAAAAADPYGFCSDLLALVEEDGGSLMTLGASRLVWDLIPPAYRGIPPALALIRAGITFKRAHALPLTFGEMNIR
jgi:hypothetical protein